MTTQRLGYAQAFRMFSPNAKLYTLHVIGMDMIHGTWTVLFNLYLLAVGLDVRFIGLRLIVAGIVGAALSVPAGIVSDRIGRKASFILGDGVGALLGLISILTLDRNVLLATAVVGAFFGNLHHVSEPPFMHENSEPAERVHLFSLATSLRTGSAMLGSLIAGLLPLAFAASVGKVTAYRYATFIGLGLWFLSLIPAFMLRQNETDTQLRAPRERRGLFDGVGDWNLIGKLVLPEVFLALGVGLVLPLSNVFFHEGLHVHESGIGLTFAIGQGAIAIGALFAPAVAARMGKVRAVVASRAASIPFMLVLAWAISSKGPTLSVTIAMIAWAARTAVVSVSGPLESAFNMQILTLRERATLAGLDVAVFSGMGALGALISSRLIASGNYSVPFIGMACLYAISTSLFWVFFRGYEGRTADAPVQAVPAPERVGVEPAEAPASA